MLRKMKNKKGQIGEILVIVVLIILAVLGVMKYIMPMFNKSDTLASKSSGQMDSVSKATDVQDGQIISGAEIQGIWGTMCNYTTAGSMTVTGGTSTTVTNSTSYFTKVGQYVDTSAKYKATVTFQSNGDINTIGLVKQ